MNKIITSVKDVLSQITFLPNDELKLAIIGGIVTIIIFLVALLISSGSKINVLRRRIIKFISKAANFPKIDETNVDKVYAEMKSLPESVAKGWGRFLDERAGYPSDYVTARDCIGGHEYSGKNTAGKVVYSVFGVIVWAVIAFLTAGVCAKDLSASGFADLFKNFAGAASILSAVLVPVAVFVIFYFVLQRICSKQRKRLEMSFASMQDLLDERVLVPERERTPYENESLEDIAKKVDELIDGRMEDGEPIEVLSLPDGIEEELPEEPVEEPAEEPETTPVDDGLGEIEYPSDEDEEPVEEPQEEPEPDEEKADEPEKVEPVEEAEETGEPDEEKADEPVEKEEETPAAEPEHAEEAKPEPEHAEEAKPEPEPIILTQEEAERYLSILPAVVDQAIADPETTNDDLEELAEMIENARVNNFEDPADQAILIECLQKIADKYYAQ